MVRFDRDNDETMVARRRSGREVFGRVFAYLRRSPWYGLGTMVCAILSTLAALAFPRLVQVMIDDVIDKGRGNLVVPMAGLLLLACFLRDFFNFVRIQLNNRFEQRVIFDMRCDLYNKLQRLSVSYFDKRATGDLMTRVTEDIHALERVLIDGIEQGTVAVLSLVGVGVMMYLSDPHLMLWAIVPIPLLLTGATLYTATAHRRYRAQRVATSELNSLLHDNLQGIRQIKGFGREPHESRRFASQASHLRAATLRIMGAWSIYSPSMEFAAWLGYVLVFWQGGKAVMAGQLQIGQFVMFLLYLTMFYQPVRMLHMLNQLFQAGRAAGERVFDILDAGVEVGEQPGAVVLAEGERGRGEVEFRHVAFAYRPDMPVLHDLDIHARPGLTIALVGPTGAGKSTVVNLLARFYDVSAGAILVDGVDIREVTLASLRRQVGMVTQEAFLFNGSIRENILYGRLDATEDEMRAAAQAANCDEFIRRLPEGYDSRVGERGVRLSVGEKQRVSIARALLKDPPILILDEATASVDTATERLIQEALDRLLQHRTSFVIAHRLSTVRHADLILVLDRGRVIERGTHDELLARDGLYARLCRGQSTAMTIEEQLATAGTEPGD
ncbi:ABC transporter ATP-binding protein [bacterium]|nr:ABC transporter ATP-binding protein [bacterium]